MSITSINKIKVTRFPDAINIDEKKTEAIKEKKRSKFSKSTKQKNHRKKEIIKFSKTSDTTSGVSLISRSDRRNYEAYSEIINNKKIINNDVKDTLDEKTIIINKIESSKEGSLDKINETYKIIMDELAETIYTQYSNYEKIGLLESPDKKKLRKELFDKICLFKIFYEQNSINKSDIINTSNQEKGKLEVKTGLKIFDKITKKNKKTISSDKPDKINEAEAPLDEKINTILQIEKEVIKQQNAWKPEELTRELLLERMQIIPQKDLISKIEKINFKELDLKTKGLVGLSEELDLISTSKNNYYIALKSHVIGTGSSKKVCYGFCLSKNKPIAVSYLIKGKQLMNKNKTDKIFNEELTYIKLQGIEGIEGIAKSIDCLQLKESKNECIFISELYSNGDLGRDLESETSKVKKNKNIFSYKLINTVNEIIKRDVFLSDLKPQNIYLYNKENLSDSQAIDDDVSPRIGDLDTNNNTLAYAAPEIVNGKGKTTYNEKTVVWSLGMTLYEVYCGQFFKQYCEHNSPKVGPTSSPSLYTISVVKSFTDETIQQLIKERISEQVDDALFLEIIQSMLETNPETRSTISKVKNAWNQD